MFYEFSKKNEKFRFEGVEINKKIANLCKLNLLILQIGDFYIENINYLFTMKRNYDLIISDLPFGMRLNEDDMAKIKKDILVYGPSSKIDGTFTFIQKIISDLSSTGRAIVLTTSSILFREGSETKIRRGLVEDDLIESIIQLPPNILLNK